MLCHLRQLDGMCLAGWVLAETALTGTRNKENKKGAQ